MTRERTLGVADGLLLAALLTVMCWLGIKYAPLAMSVAGYFLLMAGRDGRTALFTSGAASAGFYAWFHLPLFGSLTPYGVNVVYSGWNSSEILCGHIEWGERYYRLWGLFKDRHFGAGRWAPVFLVAVPGLALLAMSKPTGLLVLALILMQMLVATFVAITMIDWWFLGSTLLTVLPLFVVPVVMVIARASLWGRISVGRFRLLVASGMIKHPTSGREIRHKQTEPLFAVSFLSVQKGSSAVRTLRALFHQQRCSLSPEGSTFRGLTATGRRASGLTTWAGAT